MATAYTQITVDRDPTIWTLQNPISDPAEITRSSAPLALGVRRPLSGILLLSVRAAAFVTLYPGSLGSFSPTPTGWIFDDLPQPGLFLYLPSVSIPAATGPVLYQVAGTTQAGLQTTITTAMTSSQKVSVSFEIAGSVGEVVVNGAALPFVVIVPT
jgi:hypothetical protein